MEVLVVYWSISAQRDFRVMDKNGERELHCEKIDMDDGSKDDGVAAQGLI